MTYEIVNHSEDEVWIYTGGYLHFQSTFGMGAGADVSEDGHTLILESRLSSTEETKNSWGPPGCSRFVRLGPGENQKESIFTEIPVHPSPRFDNITRKDQATHLAVELNYYQGDLSKYFFRVLEYNEKNRPIDSRSSVLTHFYSWTNEPLISREDELLIRDEYKKILVLQILRTVVDNVRIPYEEVSIRHVEYDKQDFTSCTKVEIKYQPFMLDYFFPFAFQKNLLSPEELNYLQSEKVLILENTKEIRLLANDINKAGPGVAFYGSRVERYRCSVNIVCYYDDKLSLSCVIYNDDTIKIDSDIIHCTDGFPCLKKFTPRIQEIDLRMRCAANLKNQWYKFRYYNYDEAERIKDSSLRNQKIYPKPSQWCDDIGQTYPVKDHWWKELHICPSAGEGKNHYAMNPNCEPNSPDDMVLLFETKAGWNQCGGPELFTFDNHDPKGGCVLLNDGTVKFIRTPVLSEVEGEQELHALRWKELLLLCHYD
jgi:hypothetical protein